MSQVRKLTGRKRVEEYQDKSSSVTAEMLNHHYASISNESSYTKPDVKITANQQQDHITEWRMFNILKNLRQTATGTYRISSWFLKVWAHVFAGPLATLMNMSLNLSVVPRQRRNASILPIPRVSAPKTLNDYRPISITSVLSRTLELIVVRDFIYPSLQSPLLHLDFSDQFAFHPGLSTTAALIHLLHNITTTL